MDRDILGVGAVAGLIAAVVLLVRKKPPVGEAEFIITDLYIHPEVAEVGSTVYIEATATNIGDASGSYTVVLSGNLSGERTVTLSPGAAQVVTFEARPDVIGVYSVQVDGLWGSFEIVAPLVPDIRVAAHVFCPYEGGGSWKGLLDSEAADPSFWGEHQGGIITSAPVNTYVSLWVLIANYGDAHGSRVIKCNVSGGISSHTVSLDPGYATWVQFQIGSYVPDTKEIYIDYQGPTEVFTTFPFV